MLLTNAFNSYCKNNSRQSLFKFTLLNMLSVLILTLLELTGGISITDHSLLTNLAFGPDFR